MTPNIKRIKIQHGVASALQASFNSISAATLERDAAQRKLEAVQALGTAMLNGVLCDCKETAAPNSRAELVHDTDTGDTFIQITEPIHTIVN